MDFGGQGHSTAHLCKFSELSDAREGRLPSDFRGAQDEPAVGGQGACQQLRALLCKNGLRLPGDVLAAHMCCAPHCDAIHRHLLQSSSLAACMEQHALVISSGTKLRSTLRLEARLMDMGWAEGGDNRGKASGVPRNFKIFMCTSSQPRSGSECKKTHTSPLNIIRGCTGKAQMEGSPTEAARVQLDPCPNGTQ